MFLDFLNIRDDSLYRLLIEAQRIGVVVEYAHIVHNQTTLLLSLIHAIGSTDGLQQRMILHRFFLFHKNSNDSTITIIKQKLGTNLGQSLGQNL